MLRRLSAVPLLVALVMAGCGEEDGAATASRDAAVQVVATTTHLTDLARNVGGTRAGVTGLLPVNADPHDHEIRPRDMESLTGADLVLRSGGDLDEWLTEAIEGSGTDAPVLDLIEHVATIEEGEHGHEDEQARGEAEAPAEQEAAHGEGADPHWWQDPRNARRAVEAIRDALIDVDPEGREAYTGNARRYLTRLAELDAAIEACMRRVPDHQRKLVATHDSLGYYADRYGIDVVGAIIPSLSTAGQPSAGETRELVETIRREDVEAVFTESAVNPKVERAIAEEAGATVGTPLWADSLGPEGSEGATYLDALAANTRALADGFTSGRVTCELPS